MLLERGVPVRALVHRDDERSNNIRALGAEIIEGDLLDLHRNAMGGIRRAYFAYPVQDGCWKLPRFFAANAREAGLELVVNLSQLLTRRATTRRRIRNVTGSRNRSLTGPKSEQFIWMRLCSTKTCAR